MKFWTHVSTYRDHILLRGIDNGRRIKERLEYTPMLYTPCGPLEATHRTLEGKPVKPHFFDSIGSARDTLKNKGAGSTFYGVDKWHYAYLEQEYKGEVKYDQSFVRIGIIDIETKVGQGFPHPEEAEQEITAITFKVGDRVIALAMPSFDPETNERNEFTPPEGIEYYECYTEQHLLMKFVQVWGHDDICPDILTGWNVDGFDVPYLVNRMIKVCGEETAKKMSPWRRLERRRTFMRGEEKEYQAPAGISILDYPPLYKKLAVMTRAVVTPDDYKLDTIAEHEGVGRKINYDEYDGLMGLYENNFQMFMEYNIRDVILVDKIEDKRGLISLVIDVAYQAKVNYEDAMKTVAPWEQIIHCDLMEQGIVMPPRRANAKEELVGAFVKDPPVGMYRWVVSEDLDSLYSHLMMQFNISPETRVGVIEDLIFDPYGHAGTTERGSATGELRQEAMDHVDRFIGGGVTPEIARYIRSNDLILAANGCTFRREKGFLPKILEKMYAKRAIAKAKVNECARLYEETKDPKWKREQGRWKNSDKVQKTFLNGCYGVTTNDFYLFYDHGNAEAITMGGQLAIRWIEGKLNGFLNEILGTEGRDYVIAIDTDSVYLNLEELVGKTCAGKTRDQVCEFLDRVCKQKINPFISQSYAELAELVNAAEQKMSMKRESIADRAIWTGKKHYIMNILDKEGTRFKEPEIELKGIAAVKSDTPRAAREKLKEGIRLIMNGTEDDVLDLIERTREDFMTLPFDEIAFSKGVNLMKKYADWDTVYKKGTPIQVKGALLYNHMLKRKGLEDYPPIFDGDKIKYALLKLPNVVRDEVIATPGPLPASFQIEESMDRGAHFEKGFLKPMSSILDAIGWRSERTATLEVEVGPVVAAAKPTRSAPSAASLDAFF